MRVAGAQTFVVMAHATFNRDAALLTGLALEAGLPTVREWAEMARLRAKPRRAAAPHSVRCCPFFRGVSPGDLPIDQSILGRADEVIECGDATSWAPRLALTRPGASPRTHKHRAGQPLPRKASSAVISVARSAKAAAR